MDVGSCGLLNAAGRIGKAARTLSRARGQDCQSQPAPAALANGPVTLVSPLVATYPLVTVILSALCLSKVETGVRTFVGVALTVAGVVLLIVG